MSDNKNTADDIVSMLDNMVANGVGHMNIEVDAQGDQSKNKSVEQLGCLDCAKGNLACAIPTLHEGIDEEE